MDARYRVPRWTVAVLLLATALRCDAQQPPSARPESLVIGAGDLLSVHVFREPDLDTQLRVQDAGTIALPLIGSVMVAGLPAVEAAARIGARYSASGFLNHPEVAVLVEQASIEQVAVLGEVARPGTVRLTGPRSVLDVLAEAGGLLKTADRHITIRKPGRDPVTVLIANDAATELPTAQLMVEPGDTVLVPRAGIVYVLGDVGRPGGYLMQDDAHLSLLQALALAAGAQKTAAEGRAHLIRTVHGTVTDLPVQLKARERGKLADLPLENNDILYIPFSFAKNMAMGASSVAASASSAIIYAAY